LAIWVNIRKVATFGGWEKNLFVAMFTVTNFFDSYKVKFHDFEINPV